MNIETLNKLIRCLNITSKDATRFTLAHVLMEKSGKTVSMTATDGHKMIRLFSEDEELSKLIPKSGVMILDESIKQLKALKNKFVSSFSMTETHMTINGFSFPITINKGEYPDYKQVIPNLKDKETIKLAFNAEYIESILLALKDSRSSVLVLEFEKSNDSKSLKPIVIKQSIDAEDYSVLMPCRY